MDIAVSVEKEYALIRLTGRLEATQAAGLTESIQNTLREGSKNLILDCSGLSYVASMGLRCFLLAQKGTQNAKGKLVFFGLNDNVRSVFTLTGFDKIAALRTNLEEAKACLSPAVSGS
ncbi:MAG: STAS domain-containing protein [Deltaproteobacteria bacterium]|jgi:anti-anti-sigma factor|nr:STAS domain-containing protein [Deltaproteobacteria bacterium]